jgi:hypothetical protein
MLNEDAGSDTKPSPDFAMPTMGFADKPIWQT